MIGSMALIIDDKESDGLALTKTLWRKGHPCLFFEYSEEKLTEEYEKISGIRIIFQDINLISGSAPSTADYDQAVLVIDKLLDDHNGPWLLATWSTWESENDHARKLFEHLRRELSISKRPFDFVLLEKGLLSAEGAGTHSAVKDPLSNEEYENLYLKCLERLNHYPSFNGITKWEKELGYSAQKTVHDISTVPMELSPEYFDHSLGEMLHRISVAELGRNFSIQEKAKSVSRVLNNLASNKSFFAASINETAIRTDPPANEVSHEVKRIWSRKTNYILHFEKIVGEQPPGSVFLFKKPKHYYLENNFIDGLDNFYSDQVLKTELLKELQSHSAYDAIFNSSSPILIDITPPCDHSQKKSQWRKFITGIEVIIPKAELSTKGKEKRFLDLQTMGNKWRSPCFMEDTDLNNVKFIYVDLRLVMSVPDNEQFLDHLSFKYSIKEQLLRDMVGAISNHMSRPGIVDLAR